MSYFNFSTLKVIKDFLVEIKAKLKLFVCLFLITTPVGAKEIALSFDDAPVHSTDHFASAKRSEELIKKLKDLYVPGAMIFANPCKDEVNGVAQLKKYVDAGHFIANHTCSHPRLDDIGFDNYSADILKADKILAPLMKGEKFFRFPFLNESKNKNLRDQMRVWLKNNHYRNGMVSIDNDDYIVSWAINNAREQGKAIDYKEIEKLFLNHVLSAVDFYDDLAQKKLGYSPKHVILLHEVDATVLFVGSLVKELRRKGWTIISAREAYEDKLYYEQPQNTYDNNGIVAQMVVEKTGEKIFFDDFNNLKKKLVELLEL